jgi:predicted ATPase
MIKHSHSPLKSPFLRQVSISGLPDEDVYPFNLPFFNKGRFSHRFTEPVTILVGENATGKSTLLEAIAGACGFNLAGGSRDHRFGEERSPLAPYVHLTWMPRMTQGFFLRAESFFNFATYVDEVNERPLGSASSLHSRSHGEAFTELFYRYFENGIYILDEPEAALSPVRQLAFLKIVKDCADTGRAQFIIATHSPILMAIPGAQVLEIDEDGLQPVGYEETLHFQLYKAFLNKPEKMIAETLRDDE